MLKKTLQLELYKKHMPRNFFRQDSIYSFFNPSIVVLKLKGKNAEKKIEWLANLYHQFPKDSSIVGWIIEQPQKTRRKKSYTYLEKYYIQGIPHLKAWGIFACLSKKQVQGEQAIYYELSRYLNPKLRTLTSRDSWLYRQQVQIEAEKLSKKVSLCQIIYPVTFNSPKLTAVRKLPIRLSNELWDIIPLKQFPKYSRV